MIKTWLTGTCLCASVLFTGCAVTPSTSSTDSTTKTAVTSSSSANASTANALLDRNWTATEINGFQISTQVANKPSLKFDSKTQRFSGTDGCNRMMGSFKADAESLQLGAAASTKMMCLSKYGSKHQCAISASTYKRIALPSKPWTSHSDGSKRTYCDGSRCIKIKTFCLMVF